MRRLVTWCAAALAAVAVIASLGGGTDGPGVRLAAAAPVTLPVPLPERIKALGYLSIGVKCDYPPFGFVDAAGRNAGYEIDVARRMAEYAFGTPAAVRFTCVTSSNRIPFLTTNRIDLILATMTYTPERAKVVHFSLPYFSAGGRMLVPVTSPLKEVSDLNGKSVILIKGTVYVTWFSQCQPSTQTLQFDTTSEAVAALLQGRAPAFVQDDTLLVDLAAKNKNLKVVGKPIAASPWGMGTRLDDEAFAKWVDAAIEQMQKEDFFWRTFQKWIVDPQARALFSSFVPRPNHSLTYPTSSIIKCTVD
jgi:polar amino acid transport system substrate-binding protein